MGSHHQGPRREVEALDAYVKLVRAANSVLSRATAHLAREGLTVGQFGALEALLHRGPMCQRDLAGKLLTSDANLTTVVSNLERRGLVRRERSTVNRKFVTVVLTPEGRRTIRRVFPLHVREVLREMGALSRSDQRRLGALCRRVGRRPPGAGGMVRRRTMG